MPFSHSDPALPTLVLGASENPARYANMAIRRLRAAGFPVIALGLRPGQVGDVAIGRMEAGIELPPLDTVTLYLNPVNQQPWEAWILSLKPRRVIFNPGTENPAFASRLSAAGIHTVEGCTLVMIGVGTY